MKVKRPERPIDPADWQRQIRRLRAEFIAGAEEEWRKRNGRPMTVEELERVLRRYRGTCSGYEDGQRTGGGRGAAERRGGRISVVLGPGKWADYDYVGREYGAPVISGPGGAPRRFWVVRTDIDRAALVDDIDLQVRTASPDAPGAGSIIHGEILESTGGTDEVYAIVAALSLVVGLFVGVITALMIAGHVSIIGVTVGLIVGIMLGFFAVKPLASVVTVVPALRDRTETLAFCWFVIVPGAVVASTIMVTAASGLRP